MRRKSENCGLKFDTLYWRHLAPAAQRKMGIGVHNYKSSGIKSPGNIFTGRRRETQPAGIVFTHGPIFWFFYPAGATRCTDQGEIWQGGAGHAKFHLDQLRCVGLRPPNFENLEFYQYNCP